MANTGINQGFERQRRNLIIISITNFLVYAGQVEFKKISIFGNNADINNPDAIKIFLWILFFYWLWRYWSYFTEYCLYNLKSKYLGRLHDIVFDKAVKIEYDRVEHKIEFDKFLPHIKLKDYSYELFDVSVMHQSYARFDFQCDLRVVLNDYDGNTFTDGFSDYKFSLLGKDLLISHIKCIWDLAINTTWFNEYLLPFLVAMIAMATPFYIDYFM